MATQQVRIIRDRSLGIANDMHHLHPSEVEVKMSDGTRAELSCGDPCTNPILGGGKSRILYVHKKDQPNYSIASNEVQAIMQATRSAFPSATIASVDDIRDMANDDKALCACGWVVKTRQQQLSTALTASDLTTAYPSIPGTVGGCGGGQRAAISCGDAGPSWAGGKAGLFVKVDFGSTGRQGLDQLRRKLAAAHISNVFDYNVGNFAASGPEKLFDGDIRSSYHSKYGGSFPYGLEDHFVNLAVTPSAESKARSSTVSEITVRHAHPVISRATGVRVEVREGDRLLWQSVLRPGPGQGGGGGGGVPTFVALDPARQSENRKRNRDILARECLRACVDKCQGPATCEAQCASLMTTQPLTGTPPDVFHLMSGTLPGSNLEIRNEIAKFITCEQGPPQVLSATQAAPKPRSREEQLTAMLRDPNAAKAEVETMLAECKAKGDAVFGACDECSRNSGNCRNDDQRNAVAARCEEAKRVHNPDACTATMRARQAELNDLTAGLDAFCRAEYGTTCDNLPSGVRAGAERAERAERAEGSWGRGGARARVLAGLRLSRAGNAAASVPNELTIYYDSDAKDIVYGDKLLDYSEGEPDVDWSVANENISGQGGYGFLAKGYRMIKGKVVNKYTGVIVSNKNGAEQAKWKERAVRDARYAYNFPMQFWPVRAAGDGLPAGAVLPSTTNTEAAAQFRVRTQMRTVNFEPKEMVLGTIDREDGWWGYWSKAEWLKASYAWAPIALAGIASGVLHAGIWIGGAACTLLKGAAYAGCWTAMAGCEARRGVAYGACHTEYGYCEGKRGLAYAGCWTAMAACKATNVGAIGGALFEAGCTIGNPPYPCNIKWWGGHSWCKPQSYYRCIDSAIGGWIRQKERERNDACDASHENCKNGFARSANCEGKRENCLNEKARHFNCQGVQENCLNGFARSSNCDVSSAHRWATRIVTDTADALWPHSRDADPDGLIGVEVSRFGTVAHYQARQNLPCLKRSTNQIKCLPCEADGGGEHECATLSTSSTIPETWRKVFEKGTFKDGVGITESSTMNDLFPCPMPDFVTERGAANIPHDIMSSIRVHSNSTKHTSISNHPYKVEAPGWAGPRCDTPADAKTYLKADHCREPVVGTVENFFSGQRDTIDKNFYTCAYKSGAVSTAQDLQKFVDYFRQGHVAECCSDNCWFVPHNASIPFSQGMPQDFAANLVANFHNAKVRAASDLCAREKDAMVASIDDALGSARMDGAHGRLRNELRELKTTVLTKPQGPTCRVCGLDG